MNDQPIDRIDVEEKAPNEVILSILRDGGVVESFVMTREVADQTAKGIEEILAQLPPED